MAEFAQLEGLLVNTNQATLSPLFSLAFSSYVNSSLYHQIAASYDRRRLAASRISYCFFGRPAWIIISACSGFAGWRNPEQLVKEPKKPGSRGRSIAKLVCHLKSAHTRYSIRRLITSNVGKHLIRVTELTYLAYNTPCRRADLHPPPREHLIAVPTLLRSFPDEHSILR